MPLQLGSLTLDSNLFLAPLAGYTNLPFRLIVREIGGAGLCTTDLVNARSLLERHPKAFQLITTDPADRPLAVQLYGTVPEELRDAALLLEARGIAAVDINMGCPVRKVCRHGGGSALLNNLAQAQHLVRTVVAALKIPVTCKMRLGWDDANLTAPDAARAFEDVGVAGITVHGRTRQQGFGGVVNLAGIRAVVQAVRRVPVIGNGDITTPQAARAMFEQTGCAGISIGRGAFYNPWIFRQITTGQEFEPSFEERIAVMARHLNRMIEVFGEEHGCLKFRKVAVMYSKRFGPVAEFHRRIVLLRTRAEFDEIVTIYRQWRTKFLDARGDLLPGYAPRDPSTIPVPAGPNERW
jgi:nifR3 family TIM-barrel protein